MKEKDLQSLLSAHWAPHAVSTLITQLVVVQTLTIHVEAFLSLALSTGSSPTARFDWHQQQQLFFALSSPPPRPPQLLSLKSAMFYSQVNRRLMRHTNFACRANSRGAATPKWERDSGIGGERRVVAALPGTPCRASAVLFWCCGTGPCCTHTSSLWSARQTRTRAATCGTSTPCLESPAAASQEAATKYGSQPFLLPT